MSLTVKLTVLLLVAVLLEQSVESAPRRLQVKWSQHMSKYQLAFADGASEQKSYEIYERNVDRITAANNNPENTFKQAENQFTHLDPEFIKDKILLKPEALKADIENLKATVAPEAVAAAAAVSVGASQATVNWTSKFGPIKDQGYCGCCYAFSGVGAIEGAYAIKYGKTISLSDEQAMECTTQFNNVCSGFYSVTCQLNAVTINMGCSGGSSYYVMAYAAASGLYTSADYPYTSYYTSDVLPAGTCHNVTSPTTPRVKISSYSYVYPYTESALASRVLNYGPVTAYFDASLSSFHSYSSGIYNDARCSSWNVNHAVVVVGYGTDSSAGDYWIIRNSWGTSWGMNGYGLVARNKNSLCGIAYFNLYATF